MAVGKPHPRMKVLPKARQNSQLPSWFLQNCVETVDDFQGQKAPLGIRVKDSDCFTELDLPAGAPRSNCQVEKSNSSATDGQLEFFREPSDSRVAGSAGTLQTTRDQDKADDSDNDIYEIEPAVYQALYSALEEPPPLSNPSDRHSSILTADGVRFKRDAIYLRYPDYQKVHGPGRFSPHKVRSGRFLSETVRYFARDIGAHLVTLGWDDIQDLALHFESVKNDTGTKNTYDVMQMYFGWEYESRCKWSPWHRRSKKNRRKFPIDHLLRSPSIKLGCPDTAETGQVATIIHVPEVERYLDEDVFEDPPSHETCFFQELRTAIFNNTKQGGNVLLISSSQYATWDYDREIMHLIYADPKSAPICMTSVRSEAQENLFRKDDGASAHPQRKNIRDIRRGLRERGLEIETSPLLEPYVEWAFLDPSSAANPLATSRLLPYEIHQLVDCIGCHADSLHIESAIVAWNLRRKALETWDQGNPNKWSSFSPDIQRTVNEIQREVGDYELEERMLDLVVDPRFVEEGWSDIQLESDVREIGTQLIDQPLHTGHSAYGTLKKGQIGGALLYGPPGTGKTHLARVLARELQAVMICATSAEIEDQYVGETEKAIKALFNLGRMLAPSIIFIDEADALFRSRNEGARTFEWSRVNQLLNEMDGCVKSENAPFVLLATNMPGALDNAVLRRVPARLHMGLPSLRSRQRIFEICLRDEELNSDVDVQHLSRMTQRYSGSDIKTLCVQAALFCEGAMKAKNLKTKRVIEQIHFEKALQKTAPTVSASSLVHIAEFAKKFDPFAVSQMERD